MRVANFVLCANQSLAHRGGRNEKSRRNSAGLDAEHRLQHQWRPHIRINRRMCTDKKKLESLVGELLGRICHSLRFLRNLPEKAFGVLPDLMAAGGVNHAIACRMQQPRLWLLRDAVSGPSLQRHSDGVAERIFRPDDIA